jgi:hypothetical protein
MNKGRKMRKRLFWFVFIIVACLINPGILLAENFLGVPLMPGGKIILKQKGRLEMALPLSHDRIVAFYKEALKNEKDIRYRDWTDSTYIEDDGNRPWHSITINKEPEQGMTNVLIVKDNWTWILGTLILRFIGVFAVLVVLFGGMSLSGAIISRSVSKRGSEKKANP